MKWIKYFKINNFKGIFSRNEHMPKPKHSPCIINLDDLEGPGTHWVTCYPLKDNKTQYYFDSFGMPYPEEYKARAKYDNVKVIYNTNQYQHVKSLLRGYFCIYFLNEMHKGKSFLEVLKPLSTTNTIYNEKFITNYFL